MNILESKVIEETLFSVFVKGLPKLTDKEELKIHLEDEYKVVIKEIILLKDYSVLESYKKRLDYFYETGDVTGTVLESVLRLMNHFAKNIERNSAGIIIFEQVEDRLLFFREFFNLKEILYMYFKKGFIYRGKRIYLEPIPSLKMIDWSNCKYSIEKTLSSTKIKFLFSFLVYGIVYYGLYNLTLFISKYRYFEDIILNSIITHIILVVYNILLKFFFVFIIDLFKLSDNYLKEITKAYLIAHRNFQNTVFINLLLFRIGIKTNYSILFMIIFQNLKLGFLSICNFDYIYRKISYTFSGKNKLNSQEKFNNILGVNTFNFMTAWEGFKICFYLMIFILIDSFTLGLVALIFLILHYYMIKYSFVRSRIRDFNINYYGFYYSHTLKKEILNIGKFFLIYFFVSLYVPFNVLMNINVSFDFFIDIFDFKSFYNKFYINEKYYNVKFTRKFEDEKYVNINVYMKEVADLAEKIRKTYNISNKI
jgi:hypothetical protein